MARGAVGKLWGWCRVAYGASCLSRAIHFGMRELASYVAHRGITVAAIHPADGIPAYLARQAKYRCSSIYGALTAVMCIVL